jgi:inosose dehydratase
MSVRLGISPIGWSNDDLPELGGDIPLDTCLAETSEAGFEGIELGHKFPRDPPLLQSLLGDHELHLVSRWYSGRLLERSVAEELVAIEPHRALLATMESAVLVYAETSGGIAGDRTRPLSRRPSLLNGHWRDFGIHLTELADRLAERGIRLAYHHHMETVVETADEIDRLMASTGGSVGLLLDTGHLAFAGANPVDIAWRHGLRISHVHCKDVRPDVLARARAADQSFLDSVIDGVFTVPGDGAIDFVAVLGALKAANYRGWLVVEAEQDPAKAPPLVYARRGFAYLSAALRDMGW